MPVHDWTVPPVGLYHHFHQSWAVILAEGLNEGVLPAGYFALVDQRAIGLVPDGLALKTGPRSQIPGGSPGGLALRTTPPQVRYTTQATDAEVYATRANRVAVRNAPGELVSLIEIVSPGNKSSRHALRAFVTKTLEFLDAGVHVLVVDLFPPTPRGPQGIHKAIWDEVREEPFELPPDKRLTAASYSADLPHTAYVEPVGVGDPLPAMPVLLEDGMYVPAPLEATYQRTWDKCPEAMKEIVQGREAT